MKPGQVMAECYECEHAQRVVQKLLNVLRCSRDRSCWTRCWTRTLSNTPNPHHSPPTASIHPLHFPWYPTHSCYEYGFLLYDPWLSVKYLLHRNQCIIKLVPVGRYFIGSISCVACARVAVVTTLANLYPFWSPEQAGYDVHPIKYTHGYVVLCFVLIILEVFSGSAWFICMTSWTGHVFRVSRGHGNRPVTRALWFLWF